MNGSQPPRERPDYGIDAPDVVRRLLMFGTAVLVVNFAAPTLVRLLPAAAAANALVLARSLGIMGYVFVVTACALLWGSQVGKLRLRDKLLATIPWRGDERVLDVGCGHGLLLAGAAQRLATGRAIGVDIWRNEDQARNTPEATLRNIRLEGMAERVEVRTADARALPFDADSFDVVLSSWALHSIAAAEERARALAEMVRVLKPGGRLVVVDVRHARDYAGVLRGLGCKPVQVSGAHFLFVIPSHVVTARKPLH